MIGVGESNGIFLFRCRSAAVVAEEVRVSSAGYRGNVLPLLTRVIDVKGARCD